MKYLFDHTSLGFCWWDLIAAIILVGIIVYAIWKLKKIKQEKEMLEQKLASDNAGDAIAQDKPAPAIEQNA